MTEQSKSGNRVVFLLIGLVLIIALIAVVYMFTNNNIGKEALTARIVNTEGSVLVQTDGKAAAIPAEPEMILKPGDILTTGIDSFVEIEFEDGSISRAGSETRLVLSDLHRTRDGSDVTVLSVEPGRLWNSVKDLTQKNSRFEIQTPTSVAGVRGTIFSVDVSVNGNGINNDEPSDGNNSDQDEEKTQTTFRVYEGEVGVSGGKEEKEQDDITVKQGEQGSVNEGELTAPPPEKLNVLQVDDWEKDNLVEDLPIVYIEVETETKTILLEITEEKIKENTEKETELQKQLETLQEMLSAENDPAKRSALEELISLSEEEIEIVRDLLAILQEERDELLAEKKQLEDLLNKILEQKGLLSEDELSELIRDEARSFRTQEKEKQQQRQERYEKISQNETFIIERTERRSEISQNAGINLSAYTPAPVTEPQPTTPAIPEDLSPVTYSISITRNITAGGTISGGGSYNSGISVTLTATPANGYRFLNWTDAGTVVSSSPSFTFNASSNRILVANFERITYNINLSVNPASGGSISGGGIYNSGASVTLTATPANGYRFLNWTDAGTAVSSSPSYTFNASSNRSLVANFERITYNINLSVNPAAGGSVSGGGTYNSGASVTLTATPANGYSFVNWTSGGSTVSTSSSYTFTAEANRNLTANFTLNQYTVTFKNHDGTVLKTQTVSHGGNATAPANPSRTGYTFTGWDKSFTNVTGNLTVTALFTVDEYFPVFTVARGPVYGEQYVSGQNWAPNSDITLTIDYSGETVFSNTYPFETITDPSTEEPGNFVIDLSGIPVTVGPGQTFTVSDGILSRTHVVTQVDITNIDQIKHIVYGVAEPGSTVTVELLQWISGYGPEFLHTIYAPADVSGNWSADFGSAGFDDFNYKEIRASQTETDDNTTLICRGVWPAMWIDPLIINVDKSESGDTVIENFTEVFYLYLGYTDFVENLSNADFELSGALAGLEVIDAVKNDWPGEAVITVGGTLVIPEEDWTINPWGEFWTEGIITLLANGHTGSNILNASVIVAPPPPDIYTDPYMFYLDFYDGEFDVPFEHQILLSLGKEQFNENVSVNDFILGGIFTDTRFAKNLTIVSVEPHMSSSTVEVFISGYLNIAEGDWADETLEYWLDWFYHDKNWVLGGSITAKASGHSGTSDLTADIGVGPIHAAPSPFWINPGHVNVDFEADPVLIDQVFEFGIQDPDYGSDNINFILGGAFEGLTAQEVYFDEIYNSGTFRISGPLTLCDCGSPDCPECNYEDDYWWHCLEGMITLEGTEYTEYIYICPMPEPMYISPGHLHVSDFDGENDVPVDETFYLDLSFDDFNETLTISDFVLGGIFTSEYADLTIGFVEKDSFYPNRASLTITGTLNLDDSYWLTLEDVWAESLGSITVLASAHSGSDDYTAFIHVAPPPPELWTDPHNLHFFFSEDGTGYEVNEPFNLYLGSNEFNETLSPEDFELGGIFIDTKYASNFIIVNPLSDPSEPGDASMTLMGNLNIRDEDWPVIGENNFGTITVKASAHDGDEDYTVNIDIGPIQPEQTNTPIIITESQTVDVNHITIAGAAEPNSEIFIEGGAQPASGTADGTGSFTITGVMLAEGPNNLSVRAQALGKAPSEPAYLEIFYEPYGDEPIDDPPYPDTFSIAVQPGTSYIAGEPISFEVEVLDAASQPLPGVLVTVELAGGTLASGTTSVDTNLTGRAVFNNLVVTYAGTGYYFNVSVEGLEAVIITTGFDIYHGVLSVLDITQQPPTESMYGYSLSPYPEVRLMDSFGNAVFQAEVAVTATLNGGGVFDAEATTTVLTNQGGYALFDNLLINDFGIFTITFSVNAIYRISDEFEIHGGLEM